MQADRSLDCRGMACPMPIVKLSKAIKEMSQGQILAVSADDPGFEADVRAWCETTGNQLKALESEGEIRTAYIAKS
jgi:TusA-related sulfurtransferase